MTANPYKIVEVNRNQLNLSLRQLHIGETAIVPFRNFVVNEYRELFVHKFATARAEWETVLDPTINCRLLAVEDGFLLQSPITYMTGLEVHEKSRLDTLYSRVFIE